MTHRSARTVMAEQGLGGLLDDVQQAVAIVQHTASGQSIGSWLADRMSRIQRLPSAVTALRAKLVALQAFFANGVSPVVPYAQLNEAERLLNEVSANAPQVRARVAALTLTLSPILPKLQAGTLDAEVLSTIGASGLDIVGTFHDVNQILADFEQARKLVQEAVTDPAIPADVRVEAGRVMAASGSVGVLTVGAVALLGFLAYKAVR